MTSFGEDSHSFGFGWAVRDHCSTLIKARSSHLRCGLVLPHVAEAIGVKEALSWIKSQLLQNVIIESNCHLLVQFRLFIALPPCFLLLGILLGIVKCYCLIVLMYIQFVKHSLNHVAHC
ncbi:uncharacterized protein LOC133819661 [Humulus lupulus]|uniref:uncharacterized protein LOC133819661 n=1 Tax=Humulus lupulus TaxID=3486 RepID=UPI002B413CE1|nr:uncharacterized protein LOC133819661 [Humulus lupulus]